MVMFSSTKTLTMIDKNTVLHVNFVYDAKNIREDLKWYDEKVEYIRLRHS